MPGKPDYPGLLRAGFHVCTLDQVRDICVSPFELSKTRQTLWENLGVLVGRFQDVGICCDLWVDGSFVTRKIDPNDIDVVAELPAAYYDEHLDSNVGSALEWFDTTVGDELSIDAYHFPYHPEGSPLRHLTDSRHSYWENLFGTGWDNATAKGIIIVQVNGGAR